MSLPATPRATSDRTPRRVRALAGPALSLTVAAAVGLGTMPAADAVPAPTALASSAASAQTVSALWGGTAAPQAVRSATKQARSVGTAFSVTQVGRVTTLRFYKTRGDRGQHRLTLSANGRVLASAVVRRESASGWQSVTLSQPVTVVPGTTYTVSYDARRGRQGHRPGAFAAGQITRGDVVVHHGVAGRVGRIPTARTTTAYFADATVVRVATQAVSTAEGTATTFPTAATTGYVGSVRNFSSLPSTTITRDGTVLQNAVVNGQLTIRANNVTVRNVWVNSNAAYGVLTYGRGTVVEDTDVTGKPGVTRTGIAALDGGRLTARRVDVATVQDGVQLNHDSSLLNSYVHDLQGASSSSSTNGVLADGRTGWKIQGNSILNPRGQTAAVWIGDKRYAASQGVLSGNLIAGGGYSIYAGPGTTTGGLSVTGNTFSTRYFPRGGQWGPVTAWTPQNNTWSGNTWQDGASAGQALTMASGTTPTPTPTP